MRGGGTWLVGSDLAGQLVFATASGWVTTTRSSTVWGGGTWSAGGGLDGQLVFATASGWVTTTTSSTVGGGIWHGGVQEQIECRINLKVGNFWARYINGNSNERKGVKNSHLNIRSLRYKVVEIKKIVKEQNIHIIGLSECELKQCEQFDIKSLKIPGYNLLLPKSWDSAGFARVVVYVKKSLHYTQVHELEDDLVQTIWLKGGFKNAKQVYFCHGYREHQSSMGKTINAQKAYLDRFILQWEAATMHGNPSEPNEVHICCDMNIDIHNGRWLEANYPLLTLSKLVQSACRVSNFSQLVSGITRTQYNSVSSNTDMSCIDHIYCNYKHRCSGVSIITNGASDHDQLSYTRFSKAPPCPARIIRKRSFN